jgi:hypothetical protein
MLLCFNVFYNFFEKLEVELININRKICKEPNCNISPSYNYINKCIPLYCNIHKKENMINIISDRCIYINCNKIPIYNYLGQNKGIYCNKHKLDNMKNIKIRLIKTFYIIYLR